MHAEDAAKLTPALATLTAAVRSLTHALEEARRQLQGANVHLADRYPLGVVSPEDADEPPTDEPGASRSLDIRCPECNGTLARIEGEEVVLTIECQVCGARYQPDPARLIDVKKA